MASFLVSLLTLSHLFVLLAIAFSLLGSAIYIKDTLAGKTTPNKMTWSMWAAATFVVGMVALFAGADRWITARVFVGALGPALVFWSSYYNPKGHWKLKFFDVVCGACSALALLVWFATGFQRTAVLLAVVACAFVALPTIGKAWTAPKTETGITYLFYLLSVLVILPAVPVWNVENLAFQVYLFLVSAVALLGIYRKKMYA